MTPARPPRPSSLRTRLAGAVVTCVLLVVVPAAPASAHGPTPDGTNYRSTVTRVVDSDGAPDSVPGITWRVLGGDGLLQVRASGGAEIVVTGYDEEPFLRVGPDGAFENRNSPATYLNADRYAAVAVPADVDATAPPDWRRVGSGPAWQWHDHRIHWMAPTPPPPVRDSPAAQHRISQWSVPFQAGGRRLRVQGVLDYVPPPPVWPWVLAAALALSLPIAVLLVVGRAGHQRINRLQVVLTIGVAAAGVAMAVGDALVTPASLLADAWAVVQTAGPAAVAVALAWTAWRPPRSEDGPRPESTLVVSALVVAFAIGLSRLSQLTSSQVINALPAATVRGVVAASLMLVVPATIVAVARRPARRTD